MKVLFKFCFICVYIIGKISASGQLGSKLNNLLSSVPQVLQDISLSNEKTANNHLKDPDKSINSNQGTDTKEFRQEIKHPPEAKSDKIAEIKRYKRQENTEDNIPIIEAEDYDYDSQNNKNLAMEAEANNEEYSGENFKSPLAKDFKVNKEKQNEIFYKTNISGLKTELNTTVIKDYNMSNTKKINPRERSPTANKFKIDQRNRKIIRKLSRKQAVISVDNNTNDEEDDINSTDPTIELDVSTIKIDSKDVENVSVEHKDNITSDVKEIIKNLNKKAYNSQASAPTPTLLTLPEVETEKDILKSRQLLLQGTRISTTESAKFFTTENVSKSLDETGESSDQPPITESQLNVFNSKPRDFDIIKYQQDKETLNHPVLEIPVVQHYDNSGVFKANITIPPEVDSRGKLTKISEMKMKRTSQKIKNSRTLKSDEDEDEDENTQNKIKEFNGNRNSFNNTVVLKLKDPTGHQKQKFKTDFHQDDRILSYPVLEKPWFHIFNKIKKIGTTEAVTPTIAELASRADSQETYTTPKKIRERYQSTIIKDVENNKERDPSSQNISQRHVGHTGDQEINEADKTYLTNILKENQITRSQEIPNKIPKINPFSLFKEISTSPVINKSEENNGSSLFKDMKDNLQVKVKPLLGEKYIGNARRVRKSDIKINSVLPKHTRRMPSNQSYRSLGTSRRNKGSRNTEKNKVHDIQTRQDGAEIMSTIKEDTAYLQNKLKELEKNINSHSFTMNDIQNDISFLLSDIKEIRNKFKKEEKLFESTIDLQKLESEKLKKQVENLEADVKSMEEKIKVYNKDESYAEIQLNQVVEGVNKIPDIQISLDDLIHRLNKLENHTKFVLNFESRNDNIPKSSEQQQAQKQTQQKEEEHQEQKQEENQQQPQQQQQIINLNNKVDILSNITDNEIILNDKLKTNVTSMKDEFETSINEMKEEISSMHRSLEDLAKQFETLKLERVDDEDQGHWKHLMDKVDKTHNHKEAILMKNQKHLEARLEKIMKNLKIGDQLKNTDNQDISKKKDLRSLNLRKAVSDPNEQNTFPLMKKHHHRKNIVAEFDDNVRFFKIFEVYLPPHLRPMSHPNFRVVIRGKLI